MNFEEQKKTEGCGCGPECTCKDETCACGDHCKCEAETCECGCKEKGKKEETTE